MSQSPSGSQATVVAASVTDVANPPAPGAGSCLRIISNEGNKYNRALMGYVLQSHVRVALGRPLTLVLALARA